MLEVALQMHGQHDDSTCCSLHFAEALQHSVLIILLQCCSNFEALIVTTFPLQLAAGWPWPSSSRRLHCSVMAVQLSCSLAEVAADQPVSEVFACPKWSPPSPLGLGLKQGHRCRLIN